MVPGAVGAATFVERGGLDLWHEWGQPPRADCACAPLRGASETRDKPPHRIWEGITSIGIDEIAWGRGHTYLTLVYQIGGGLKRLLAIEEHRTEESLRAALSSLGQTVCARIEFVCSDMWKPYLKVIREQLNEAVHVLDRFHIMQHFGRTLDDIRAEEAKQLKRDGYEPVLKKSRWCLLKRKENLTDQQTVKLSELLKYNLRSVRGYLLREEFQRF